MRPFRKSRKERAKRELAVCVLWLLAAAMLTTACTRQKPESPGVSQIPIDDASTSPAGVGGDELTWQISFLNTQPLSYPRDVRNTFVAGTEFAAEMTFPTAIDQEIFDTTLRRALRTTGGDPAITWENERTVLFDVRSCQGRARVDLRSVARKAGFKNASPLVVYCGSTQNVLKWSADRGTEVIGTVPANLIPASANSDHSAIFYHLMRASDGGTDAGVWLADFSARTLKPLAVHYLGAELRTAFTEGSSLVISTGGDDLQVFGGTGVRVRQFDPEDLGLIVGMVVDERGRIALFEGTPDDSGRSGETRLRLLDRNFTEIARMENVGRLSRLSGNWRTIDAVWLDADTIAFIHWNNRFYGIVAIANISSLTVTRTSIVADELAGVLPDGRFVVRRQAGGRAGCWRAETSEGEDTTPLCERLPGPTHAEVSPDGSLVAMHTPDTNEVLIWNQVSGEWRKIGDGDVSGWTPNSDLIWISTREVIAPSDDGFL